MANVSKLSIEIAALPSQFTDLSLLLLLLYYVLAFTIIL